MIIRAKNDVKQKEKVKSMVQYYELKLHQEKKLL